MGTYIIGHGAVTPGKNTFVPTGTTIKFFSDEGDYLSPVSALTAMYSGAGETESYGAGEDVPNYDLEPLRDDQRQQQMSIDPGRFPALYVGDQIKTPISLCEDTGGQCEDGVHGCTGVFGVVKDTEILYLACRGEYGDDTAQMTRGLGPSGNRDTSADDETDTWFKWFTDNVDSNPDEVASKWDALPQEKQALYIQMRPIRSWSYTREAKNFLRDNGTETFKRFIDSPEQAKWKPMLLEDADLKAAYESPSGVDDHDLEAAQALNQSNVKATEAGDSVTIMVGATFMLVGDGHDAGHIDFVQGQANFEQGEITVKKGGLTSKGTLTVTGIASNQATVTTLLNEFSDKKVVFA